MRQWSRGWLDTRALPGVLLAFCISGCVPYVSPPSVLSVGPAYHASRLSNSENDDAVGAMRLEASLRPLAMFTSLRRRRLDVGAGYIAEIPWEAAPAVLHNLQLQLEGYPWLQGAGRSLWRSGPYLGGGPVLTSGLRNELVGWGFDAGAALEWGSFNQGSVQVPGKEEKRLGVAYGAFGLGAFLGAGLRRIADESVWTISAGIRVRLPLSAGIACCIDPTD